MRRPSVQDLEDKINQPSTPLRDIGEGGPPQIVDVAESYSAVEGKQKNIIIKLSLLKRFQITEAKKKHLKPICWSIL